MNHLTENLNTLWASLLVEELVRNGVTYFCLAPGSRCTPLTVATADHPDVRESIHHDERGVGFCALGYGRATGQPAAIVTTSGTAVANLMPAVVEASLEQIPLLILTGDRPPELRDTCANQTIDQVKIFGRYVRWFVDLPCPTGRVSPAFVLTTVDQAVHQSRGGTAGPVHINCMFREPLGPEPRATDFTEYLKPLGRWQGGSTPYTTYGGMNPPSDPPAIEGIADVLRQTERGLVVIGDLPNRAGHPGVRTLIERLQWPVYADITSGYRLGDDSGLVVAGADIFMMQWDLHGADLAPDTVLHLGGRMVSKQAQEVLCHDGLLRYILISDHAGRQDPGHRVSDRIEGDVNHIAARVAEGLPAVGSRSWLRKWTARSAAAEACLEDSVASASELSEPVVARLISRALPEDHGLFLGNSIPVRAMNSFAEGHGAAVPVEANRGASGIDGTLATAFGFAEGLQGPVTLFMGDLAFLHDLNSLHYLAAGSYPVVVLVVNNNGGGIFSFLPIARFKPYWERYFVTPHDLTFEKVAAMYGLSYVCPSDPAGLLEAYGKAVKRKGSTIIEISVDRKKSHALHRRLVEEVRKAVSTEKAGDRGTRR